MKTYNGVIFDVDGVIINTENLHFLAYQHVLKKYGYKLSSEKYKEHFSGKSIKGGILSLLLETDITGGINRKRFIQIITEQKINETVNLFKKDLVFFDDTIQFINRIQYGIIELKNIGIVDQNPILAITTGLEQILLDEVLKKHDLKNVFTVTVTPEQYVHSKPNRECYDITLKKMGLSQDTVIGVEDSPAGVDALNAAGVFSIGITNTHYAKELQKSRLVTKTLREIIK